MPPRKPRRKPDPKESVAVAGTDIVDVATDLGEVGLDRLLDEGIVRDVPVLGILVRVVRTVGAVRDWLFVRKLTRFFRRLDEVPTEDRERFVQQHQKPEERAKLGESLMLLIDRLDDMEKPDPLARLFAAYMRGDCDLETFRRLATALDRVPLAAIPELQRLYDEPEIYMSGQHVPRPGPYHSQFIAASLVDITFTRTGPTGGPGGYYAKNELGKLFLKILGPTAA